MYFGCNWQMYMISNKITTALSFIYCSQWGQSVYEITFEKDLCPIVLSLYIVLLSEKFVVLIFNFLEIRLSFFVKICPNCVLFLIFFARCIIQFRWNQPTQRTETVPFFIDFYTIFSSFIWNWAFFTKCYYDYDVLANSSFFFWHSLNGRPFLLYFFATMFLQTCKHVWLDTA